MSAKAGHGVWGWWGTEPRGVRKQRGRTVAGKDLGGG